MISIAPVTTEKMASQMNDGINADNHFRRSGKSNNLESSMPEKKIGTRIAVNNLVIIDRPKAVAESNNHPKPRDSCHRANPKNDTSASATAGSPIMMEALSFK